MPYPCQTQLHLIAGCNNRQNEKLSFRVPIDRDEESRFRMSAGSFDSAQDDPSNCIYLLHIHLRSNNSID